MTDHAPITFDAFTLDPSNELLWNGGHRIPLRPKTFALLRILASRPGQLITKEELLNTVWQDCHVGDEALKHCVAEIRKALRDNPEAPRYVETVHRRGYRFLGNTHVQSAAPSPRRAAESPPGRTRLLVGRAEELALMWQLLAKAMSGIRQIIFVSGEEGIGKTSLVDAFLEMAASGMPSLPDECATDRCLIARGQCVKSHGAGEAYMPVMEAFTGLCRSSDGRSIVALLQRYAPLWLCQMPSLATAAQLRSLQRTTYGATRERMMREMAEAMEALAAEKSLILALEDLHWSDHSTLDLISYLAQRRSPARLMILATYRPAQAMEDDHPLKVVMQDLLEHRQCVELRLPSFDESAVRQYLDHRFPGHSLPANAAAWMQQRTGGNPFFLVNFLEHLLSRNVLVLRNRRWCIGVPLKDAAETVPPTIRQMIERQLEQCSPQEQNLLKAASVHGEEFSAAAIAAALGKRIGRIELAFQSLARRNRFLQAVAGSGKPGFSYRFVHMLYQSICYTLLPDNLKKRYHRRIAEFIERRNRKRQGESAARLAMHFDRGGEPRRALQYYQIASENANSRYAGHEALDLASRAMQLLPSLPEIPDRIEHEVRIQNALGTALMSARGLGSDEVRAAFNRARSLFFQLHKRRQAGKRHLLFSSLYGLWCYHWAHAEYASARELGEHLLRLAKAERNAFMLDQAHYSLGSILMDHGEFSGALEHLEKSSNMLSRSLAEVARWTLGFPDQAMRSIEEISARALETGNPELCIFTNLCAARVHMARRDAQKTLHRAQLALDLAIEHGLVEQWLVPMRTILAWALAKQGQIKHGLEQIERALSVFRPLGATNLTPLMFAIYAELLMDAGKISQGLAAIEEGRQASSRTGMNHCDAELYRLKAELLSRQIPPDAPPSASRARFAHIAACLDTAIRIARRQQAKTLELRAALSAATLLKGLEAGAPARRRLLREMHDSFTEGFQTLDMKKARAFLQKSP